MEKNGKVYIGDDSLNFFSKWISKLLFTLISVKVWGLAAGTIVSTMLLHSGHIDNGDWLTFNTTVWALIFGMKEVFRIAESREIAEQENLRSKIKSKVEIASILSRKDDDPSRITVNQDGTITVGSEPD